MGIPILNASGCLDALAAPEVARALDMLVTKTITPEPREGNPPVRIAETEHGMLNSIGLQGPGIDAFVADHLPRLAALDVELWVSVGGFAAADFARLARLRQSAAAAGTRRDPGRGRAARADDADLRGVTCRAGPGPAGACRRRRLGAGRDRVGRDRIAVAPLRVGALGTRTMLGGAATTGQ